MCKHPVMYTNPQSIFFYSNKTTTWYPVWVCEWFNNVEYHFSFSFSELKQFTGGKKDLSLKWFFRQKHISLFQPPHCEDLLLTFVFDSSGRSTYILVKVIPQCKKYSSISKSLVLKYYKIGPCECQTIIRSSLLMH